jgi:hypothetical protein
MVLCQGHAQLLKVIHALKASSGLTNGLNCGKDQRNQNTNDRDNDKDFNQRESRPSHDQCPFLIFKVARQPTNTSVSSIID